MDASLIEFYRKFKQQIDPPTIPSGSVLKNHDVQVVLERRFFNLPASDFSAYQAKILRAVVERIQQAIGDDEDEEVSDHLMTLLATLPRSRPDVDLSKTLVSYVPPISYDQDITPIEILEAKKIIGSGPNTGLRTWEASLHLAHHLYSRPELVKGRRVLELGAGTGFLSIFCAAYLHPESVTTTDGHEEVLASMRDNVRRNAHLYASNSPPVVQKLYWGDDDDLERIKGDGNAFDQSHSLAKGRSIKDAGDGRKYSRSEARRPYDIIIGADISYDPDACKALAMTLSELAKANPYTDILISATQRNLQTLSGFLNECQGVECGLRVEVVNFEAPPFGSQTGLFHNLASPIQIFSIWRGKGPLSYNEWREQRARNIFVTCRTEDSDDVSFPTFDRWRNQLTGRPPVVALVAAANPSHDDSPVMLYPDLQGVAELVAAYVRRIKQNSQIRVALNMDAEQLSIEWSLCNRLEHTLAMGQSNFEADRQKIEPSPFRNAWETLLYNFCDTPEVTVDLPIDLPDALVAPPQYWIAMDTPQILWDLDGHIYHWVGKIRIPNTHCRATTKRALSHLPQQYREGALNTKVKAGWRQPTEASIKWIKESIAVTEATARNGVGVLRSELYLEQAGVERDLNVHQS